MKKIFVISLFILMLSLTGCGKSNAISGKYECTAGSEEITIILNGDKTFSYTQGEGTAKGKYTFEKENKNSSEGVYYLINLIIDKVDYQGEVKDYNSTVEWELGLAKDEAVFINTSNYSMMFCKKK